MGPEILLLGLLAVMVIFMMMSSRKRMAKMRAEQEAKQKQTVEGAEVLLQGGLYGTVVSFDPDNLEVPAEIELAPGVVVRVHSQAILRVVTEEEDSFDAEEDDADEIVDDVEEFEVPDDASALSTPGIETPEETRARLDREQNNKDN